MLKGNRTMVDFKNLNEPLSDWSEFLDEERREKVDRYRFYKDKALCTFAYILLRCALKKEYGIGEKPKLIYDKSGKPHIEGSDICFNFSHCDNAVACVVDRYTVGIDVQNYTETLTQVKKRFLYLGMLLIWDVLRPQHPGETISMTDSGMERPARFTPKPSAPGEL